MSNSIWKLTNSTTQKKLVVINASVDSDAPKAFYYNQATALLPFSNGNLVTPGNSDAITVPDARKDKNGYSLPFTFIVAEAETLAPVTSVTFKADLSDLSDLTVDDTTVSNIEIAFSFFKNITAFPGSQLAIDFAALDYNEDNDVSAYFNNTRDYKNVTLDALDLVHSYYNALPYGWADGKNTTIYLYSGSFENLADTEEVNLIGTIKFSNDWSLPLPLTASDKFKVELKLKDDSTKQLYFSNGVFWDSERTETAKLSLAATFGVPSQYMLDDTNNNICTTLTGTVNGRSAFGLAGFAPVDSDGNILDIFKVRSYEQVIRLVEYGLGICLGIFLMYQVGRFVSWCIRRGKPTVSQKERDAQTEELKQSIKETAETIMKQVNTQLKARVPMPNEMLGDQNAYSAEQLAAKTMQSIENVQQMVTSQAAQLETVASKMARGDLQLVADTLEAIQLKIDRGTSPEALSKFRAELPETLQQLSDNGTSIFVAKIKLSSHLTVEEREAFDRAYDAYDRVRLTQERMNEELKEIEDRADEREIIEDELID